MITTKLVTIFLLFVLCCTIVFQVFVFKSGGESNKNKSKSPIPLTPFSFVSFEEAPLKIVGKHEPQSPRTEDKCTHYTCFDIYRCDSLSRGHVAIYVYPIHRYVDEDGKLISRLFSKEFQTILETIVNSRYYTADPSKACIFVPSIDILTLHNLPLEETSKLLHSLPFWNGEGENHLLFNFIPGTAPEFHRLLQFNTGHAMIAGGGFDSWTFRPGFDIAIPVYRPFVESYKKLHNKQSSRWLLSILQHDLVDDTTRQILDHLESKHPDRVLLISSCNLVQDNQKDNTLKCIRRSGNVAPYPDILGESNFCLILQTTPTSSLLLDTIMTGCIPVVVADDVVLPFEEKIDWKRGIIRIRQFLLPNVTDILNTVTRREVEDRKAYLSDIFHKYLKSLRDITLTTLEIINNRLIPGSRITSSSFSQFDMDVFPCLEES